MGSPHLPRWELPNLPGASRSWGHKAPDESTSRRDAARRKPEGRASAPARSAAPQSGARPEQGPTIPAWSATSSWPRADRSLWGTPRATRSRHRLPRSGAASSSAAQWTRCCSACVAVRRTSSNTVTQRVWRCIDLSQEGSLPSALGRLLARIGGSWILSRPTAWRTAAAGSGIRCVRNLCTYFGHRCAAGAGWCSMGEDDGFECHLVHDEGYKSGHKNLIRVH